MNTIDILKKAENNNGWFNDVIKCYRVDENDFFSVYVFSDDENFSLDDADLLLDDNGIKGCDFIEMDQSVANYNGFDYCFVFHYNN